MITNHRKYLLRLAAQHEVTQMRRKLASSSLLAFGQLYLPEHFKLRPSRMHVEIAALLEAATVVRRARIAIAAPRGHAKSTLVSLAYVLWCLCFQREPMIMLLGATAEQAQAYLRHVKDELEQNERIARDFPELVRGEFGRANRRRWTKHEIITPTGALVLARGAGQHLRGRRHGNRRPTLVIGDDIESDEGVLSPDQRARQWDWLMRSVLNVGDPDTNFLQQGTILHPESLLARLVDESQQPSWTKRVYRAVEQFADRQDLWRKWEDIYCRRAEHAGAGGPAAAERYFRENFDAMLQGARPLWPELESYADLMRLRLDLGKFAFQSEKQNDPISPEESLLGDTEVSFWDDAHQSVDALLRSLGDHARIYIGCDPSLGSDGGSGDYSAIIVLAKDTRDNTLYVLAADIARRREHELLDTIIEYARRFPPRIIYMEANGFQRLLVDQLKERARRAGVTDRVQKQTNTTNKGLRIRALQPMLQTGRLRLCRAHKLLLEQLEQFPRAKHDDGPDALQMVAEEASRDKSEVRMMWT